MEGKEERGSYKFPSYGLPFSLSCRATVLNTFNVSPFTEVFPFLRPVTFGQAVKQLVVVANAY